MIRLRLREKRFRGASSPTLGALDLEIGDGEFAALLGPSGTGKTTLLRILAGLDTDFDGDLQPAASDLRIGYLFQEPRLMPWLTARENVALVAGAARERVPDALAAVGMSDAADLYPNQLSGGMQRRVALARAIVHRPRLLLLDEPFVSLDQPSVMDLHRLLGALWERERPAVLLVSHSLDEALTLADRLLFLGGQPATLVHEYAVDIPSPRALDCATVHQARESLLRAVPGLLSGSVGADG